MPITRYRLMAASSGQLGAEQPDLGGRVAERTRPGAASYFDLKNPGG